MVPPASPKNSPVLRKTLGGLIHKYVCERADFAQYSGDFGIQGSVCFGETAIFLTLKCAARRSYLIYKQLQMRLILLFDEDEFQYLLGFLSRRSLAATSRAGFFRAECNYPPVIHRLDASAFLIF